MHHKLLLNTLRGTKSAQIPIWFMRQAGRTLPEYRKLRKETSSFMEMILTPELMCEVTLQPVRRFALDGAIMFSDILVVPYGLGQKVNFIEGHGPHLGALEALSLDGFLEKLHPILQGIGLIQKQLPSDVTLIGFAGGPWTVATYMIEGGKSAGHVYAKKWLFENEGLVDLLTQATLLYLEAQIQAGVEVIQIFESWAACLPPPLFYRWVIVPLKTICQMLKTKFPDLPIIVFLKGVTPYYEWFYKENPFIDALNIDHSTLKVPDQLVIQGGLDPEILCMGGPLLEQEIKRILACFLDRPYIFNLSHGLLKETPLHHIAQAIEHVRGL